MEYNYTVQRVYYPEERGYRMERSILPDYMHLTVTIENGSKVLRVHSRIHVDKNVRIDPVYSTDFSDYEIIKDLSGEICHRFF